MRTGLDSPPEAEGGHTSVLWVRDTAVTVERLGSLMLQGRLIQPSPSRTDFIESSAFRLQRT